MTEYCGDGVRLYTPPKTAPRQRRERGATIVEFAVVAVLELLLIGAIIDSGLALFAGAVAQDAAYRAARYGAIDPRAVGANESATKANIANHALNRLGIIRSLLRIESYDSAAAANDITVTLPTAGVRRVKVEIVHDFPLIFLRLIGRYSVQIRREGSVYLESQTW